MTDSGTVVEQEQGADGTEILAALFEEMQEIFGFEGDEDFRSMLGGTMEMGMLGQMIGAIGPLFENIGPILAAMAEPMMEATNQPGLAPAVEPTLDPTLKAEGPGIPDPNDTITNGPGGPM